MLSQAKNYTHILPYTTCLLMVALSVSFFISNQHDGTLKTKLHHIFINEGLYTLEAQNYQDFIARRFAIEQKGSAAYLAYIDGLLANDQKPLLADEIIQNREFYSYLLAASPHFMAPQAHENWKTLREQLNPLLVQLSDYDFGLKPEAFRLADFFTSAFIESKGWLLLGNLLILFLAGSYLEYYLGKTRLVILWLSGTAICAAIYAVVNTISAPVLTGASGPITLLSSIALIHLIKEWRKDDIVQSVTQRRMKWLLFGLLVGFILKMGLEWTLLATLSGSFVLHHVVIILFGLAIFLFAQPLLGFDRAQSTPENEYSEEMDRLRRVEWAKAMDEISSLDFFQAQKRLERLIKDHTHDTELVAQLYRLAKLDGSDTYWKCAELLIETAVENTDHELACLLFNDIQKNASSKKIARERLAPNYYHKMMMIFVHHDDMERAEKAFLFLELNGNANIITDACTLLMQEYKNRKNIEKSRQYEMLLQRI